MGRDTIHQGFHRVRPYGSADFQSDRPTVSDTSSSVQFTWLTEIHLGSPGASR